MLREAVGGDFIQGFQRPGLSMAKGQTQGDSPPRLLSSKGCHNIINWDQRTIKQAMATSRHVDKNKHVIRLQEETGLSDEEWLEGYRKAMKLFKDTAYKDFVARFMYGAVHTNRQMSIFFPEKNIDPACQHCGAEVQTRDHLFQHCPSTLAFRKRVEDRIFKEPLTSKEWMVGTERPEENLVIWVFQKYVYDQNRNRKTLSLEGLAAILAEMRTIERENARELDRLGPHLNKWKKFDALIMFGREKNRWDDGNTERTRTHGGGVGGTRAPIPRAVL